MGVPGEQSSYMNHEAGIYTTVGSRGTRLGSGDWGRYLERAKKVEVEFGHGS